MGVTGARSPLGASMVRRLADDRAVTVRAVHAVERLAGVDVVVHLAPGRDPLQSPAASRADVAGTAALLEAALGAGCRRVVLVTSTEVHRAEPGQVPLPEDAPVAAPDDALLVGAWVETERLADHARRTGLDVVVVRPAALVGVPEPLTGALVRTLAAGRLLAVRGVEPLWQLCHVDDLVSALALAATDTVPGPLAVASQGWLPQREVERLSGRRRLELPAAVALSTAERLHRLGIAPGGPSDLHALLAPVVVEPQRLRAAGWRPAWTAEQALRAHLAALPPAPGLGRTTAYAGTAGATVAVVGTAALVRRARRRRRR